MAAPCSAALRYHSTARTLSCGSTRPSAYINQGWPFPFVADCRIESAELLPDAPNGSWIAHPFVDPPLIEHLTCHPLVNEIAVVRGAALTVVVEPVQRRLPQRAISELQRSIEP